LTRVVRLGTDQVASHRETDCDFFIRITCVNEWSAERCMRSTSRMQYADACHSILPGEL